MRDHLSVVLTTNLMFFLLHGSRESLATSSIALLALVVAAYCQLEAIQHTGSSLYSNTQITYLLIWVRRSTISGSAVMTPLACTVACLPRQMFTVRFLLREVVAGFHCFRRKRKHPWGFFDPSSFLFHAFFDVCKFLRLTFVISSMPLSTSSISIVRCSQAPGTTDLQNAVSWLIGGVLQPSRLSPTPTQNSDSIQCLHLLPSISLLVSLRSWTT